MKNAQEYGLALIVVTICITFFAAVVLAAIGRPVPGELQTVIITVFTALAAGVPSWLAASRITENRNAAQMANLRANYAEAQTANLRAGLDLQAKTK